MNAIVKGLTKVGQSLMKIKPVAKLVVKAGKNKPELMAISGGALVLGSFILAIKGGMQLKEVMVDTASVVEAIEAGKAQKLAVEGLSEAEKEEIIKVCNRDLQMARTEGVWRVTKLFLLPGGMLFVGLSLIGGGFNILKTRNVVLTTIANGAVNKLKFYRENVVNDLGKEADLKYLRGYTGEMVETEKTIIDENGNQKKSRKKLPVVREQKGNPWRFIFDELHFKGWVDNSESNLWFLKSANDYWKYKYEHGGNISGISMFDILVYLGYNFDVDKEGMTKQQYRDWITFLRNHGWKKGNGDDVIDFGLYRGINEPALLRKTDDIFIEFNCAGDLREMI